MHIMQAKILDSSQRKIIHIDMDCFYAAIEVRDNPQLANLPVAVGGSSDQRGVLCTCNYEARKYGVRSAMATATALKLCPNLVLLPVSMQKYKQSSKRLQAIFHQYSELVEPLSLDEAFIDVSQSKQCQGSATLIAEDIRRQIWETEKLRASAGISSNKFLAKIASGWNKPNGIFVIHPHEIESFVAKLPVKNLFGVGKVTAAKMQHLNIHTCTDLQKYSLMELHRQFGKLGIQLYHQARGVDNRAVNPNRLRKSLSVETTFAQNIIDIELIGRQIKQLTQTLKERLSSANCNFPIKSQFVKIKLANFKIITAEVSCHALNENKFITLFNKRYTGQEAVRLLGVGVSFDHSDSFVTQQLELF